MNKKKILFIAPGYYGFNEVVFEGLKKYSGCEVVHINSTIGYQYKNIFEKIYNFFLKTFFGKNLKDNKKQEHIEFMINQSDYDILLVNRPDVLSEENLNLAKQKSKFSIALFWDSMEKIPTQKKFVSYFDTCCSFDKYDCMNYNFEYITNFYFYKIKDEKYTYDISYLATYDNRIKDTITIHDYFLKNNIKNKSKIFTYKSIKIKELLPTNIEVINKIIPFNKSYKHYLDSRAILDIAHPHQEGLSFRPYEAIGMKKKLITTNSDIKNYDFYNPSNIFVIEDINNVNISDEFLYSPYQEPSQSIVEKYYIKNWVQNILSFYEK